MLGVSGSLPGAVALRPVGNGGRMARKRQRDRQMPGRRGLESVQPPQEPVVYPPDPVNGGMPQGAETLTEGQDTAPPSAGASTSVSGLLAAADSLATSATPQAVATMRAELIHTLARALELATEGGNVDQMLKVTDRLAKLLPVERASASPNTPDPAEGGDPDGSHDTGAPSAAERFRLLSGELGD